MDRGCLGSAEPPVDHGWQLGAEEALGVRERLVGRCRDGVIEQGATRRVAHGLQEAFHRRCRIVAGEVEQGHGARSCLGRLEQAKGRRLQQARDVMSMRPRLATDRATRPP